MIFYYRALKKGQKKPRWPQNRLFTNEGVGSKCPDIRFSGHILGKNFAQKPILDPTSQKKKLGYLWTPKFWKKFFFRLKNRMVKVVFGSQKCILEHFFGCSNYPLYHMSISQKFILDSKILVFWGSEDVKIPYFSRPKLFFEIWTYGMRGT